MFMQPLGRKRGRHTTLPKLQAKNKAMISESGCPIDFEFGQNAKPIVLPQLTLVGENNVESNSDTIQELMNFVEAVRSLFDEPVVLIRKLLGEGKPTFELIRLNWDEGEYLADGDPEIVAKPPTEGFWLEWMDVSNQETIPYRARLFQSRAKNIELRVSSKLTPSAALAFFRKAVSQIDFSTAKESVINNPLVSIGMTMSIGVMERVLAKIGLNILVYVAGANYVRNPAFDDIKKSILTGVPELQMIPGDDSGQLKIIFDCLPANHHLFVIAEVYLPSGEYALVMTMKLYGSSGSFVRLGINLPKVPVPMPIFFTADYVKHNVKHWSFGEFHKLLIDYMSARGDAPDSL
jgi:hypothetical protein